MYIYVLCNYFFDMKYLKMLIERRLVYSILNISYMYFEKFEKYEMFISLS